MGAFSKAADSAASALARVGQKVAGDKGVQAANKITGPLLGVRFEKCPDNCDHSDASHS
jgi:hypothetical protein